jgi:hypothetical protein
LANQFEAKLKSKSDTAQKDSEKLTLLDNLNITGSYNFLAREYALSPINITATTRIKQFDVAIGATLDPYFYEASPGFDIGIRRNRYKWQEGQGIGQISNFNLSLGKRLAPKSASNAPKNSNNANEAQLRQLNRTIDQYIDWNIPWSLNLSYQYSYSKQGLAAPITVSSLTAQGDLSISTKWRMSVSSGYDFKFKAMTFTNVMVTRDLHCWEMSFSWTPVASPLFGRSSSYDFTLRAKSSLLQELKLTRRRTFFANGGF